jgi:hypothetical protein
VWRWTLLRACLSASSSLARNMLSVDGGSAPMPPCLSPYPARTRLPQLLTVGVYVVAIVLYEFSLREPEWRTKSLVLQSNLIRALRMCVVNLIVSWGYCDTNRRRIKDRAYLITYKSETHRKRSHRWFDWRLGHYSTNRRHTLFDPCLPFNALHDHPSCRLLSGAI